VAPAALRRRPRVGVEHDHAHAPPGRAARWCARVVLPAARIAASVAANVAAAEPTIEGRLIAASSPLAPLMTLRAAVAARASAPAVLTRYCSATSAAAPDRARRGALRTLGLRV
jgi:hypothetical protein